MNNLKTGQAGQSMRFTSIGNTAAFEGGPAIMVRTMELGGDGKRMKSFLCVQSNAIKKDLLNIRRSFS